MATKTTAITFRVGPKLKAALEAAATDDEKSLGEFVRWVLQDYLDHRPSQ